MRVNVKYFWRSNYWAMYDIRTALNGLIVRRQKKMPTKHHYQWAESHFQGSDLIHTQRILFYCHHGKWHNGFNNSRHFFVSSLQFAKMLEFKCFFFLQHFVCSIDPWKLLIQMRERGVGMQMRLWMLIRILYSYLDFAIRIERHCSVWWINLCSAKYFTANTWKL